jgi:hypothetical protein
MSNDISFNIYDTSQNRLIRDPSGYIFHNYYPIIGKYTGFFYTIVAQGGYLLQQQFPTITLAKANPLIYKFDLTNTLQVKYSVDLFNQKLGTFNPQYNTFANDSLTLSASEFISGISEKQIISLGLFSNFYNDFISYVNNYFGYAEGFTTLFARDSDIVRENGDFSAKSFINLITRRQYDPSGAFVPQISGTITITDISQLLNYAKTSNVFGNRGPGVVSYGFLDGDLILVPSGISITLNLNLDWDTTQMSTFKKNCNMMENNQKYKVVPPSSVSNIKRVVTAPLLLRLSKM